MTTTAVVLERPRQLALSELELTPPGADDLIVDVEWSGISTGTERLLWLGQMPSFPGLGYPLVPGYESVGRVRAAGPGAKTPVGAQVFVPGARCFGSVRGLFGGAASKLVVADAKAVPVSEELAEQNTLLALAATAYHALAGSVANKKTLIVGHGVLGRLLARLALLNHGKPPTVWEHNPERARGAAGYAVTNPEADPTKDYQLIFDVSGDASLLDTLIARLAPGGEIVLAGFYHERPSFAFPAAFMREITLRVAAEWQPPDLTTVNALAQSGRLSLDDLITHQQRATNADSAYQTAFNDPACLKMILDWRDLS